VIPSGTQFRVGQKRARSLTPALIIVKFVHIVDVATLDYTYWGGVLEQGTPIGDLYNGSGMFQATWPAGDEFNECDGASPVTDFVMRVTFNITGGSPLLVGQGCAFTVSDDGMWTDFTLFNPSGFLGTILP